MDKGTHSLWADETNVRAASSLRFVGGVPAEWKEASGGRKARRHGGQTHIGEDRVSFQKGWFAQTLPEFMPPSQSNTCSVPWGRRIYLSTICRSASRAVVKLGRCIFDG